MLCEMSQIGHDIKDMDDDSSNSNFNNNWATPTYSAPVDILLMKSCL